MTLRTLNYGNYGIFLIILSISSMSVRLVSGVLFKLSIAILSHDVACMQCFHAAHSQGRKSRGLGLCRLRVQGVKVCRVKASMQVCGYISLGFANTAIAGRSPKSTEPEARTMKDCQLLQVCKDVNCLQDHGTSCVGTK